ncbi:MAG TPA: adenylate/guanylate cyclase domain-containing protein [Gaiellaceae bacterium]|nr:adenylate/guanylate cyclase domain-containing protein [Gaiellaceae bacterium]
MRADLPSGTVTFLFTDVEGSTTLLDELGAEAYATALAEHRRVVREACATGDGAEVDTQGDAFFLAFPTAPGAVDAARTITEGLRAGRISVRIGMHTGTPLLTEEGYVGPDVHRAARIAASAHGGQVLVSSSTAALLDRDGLVDLGEHRFKDLSAPERVYQLGGGDFAPLRSLYRTNLPVQATSFLGRRKELDEVVEILRSGEVGLLTLTGPGGTGKTRLAFHVAAEAFDAYPDGVWWAPLAPLRDARRLVSSLAQPLQVEEQPGRHLADLLAERLTGMRALLLLDNAEHLLPAVAGEIARLRDVPGPTILVTSRERLQLQGERLYAVPPLEEQDGVDLFVTRARSLDSDIEPSEVVAELCARLDNMPLALELAAARTRVFSPQQLLERLSERLDLLAAGRDADPRQQTLRATIEWSYDLLDEDDERLFRRFAVFPGSCTYEAAEAVCEAGLEDVQSLVDKSLLHRVSGEQPRFLMFDTIRELAVEKLGASGESADVRRRHADYYLALALSASLSADAEGLQRHDLVIPERENMRTALAFALEIGDHELGLVLVVALENYWATNLPEEGLEWATALLDRASAADPRLVARALRVQGGMQNYLGQLDASVQSWDEALAIARELGDDRAVAILLHRFSNTAMKRGDWPRVRELAEESLAGHRRSGGFPKGEAQALGSLAAVARVDGDLERALDLLHESRALAEQAGFRWWEAGMLANIGEVSLELGQLEEARANVRDALRITQAMHDRRGVVYELKLLSEISAAAGDSLGAGVYLGAVEAEQERAPVGPWLFGSLVGGQGLRPLETQLDLDDTEVERGREEGRRLDLDTVVGVALGDA